MPDPITAMGIVSGLSALVSGGCLYKAAKAGVELKTLEKPGLGACLDAAFRCDGEIPPDCRELLDKLK